MSETTRQLIIEFLRVLIIILGGDPPRAFLAAAARFGVAPKCVQGIWENR